MEILKQLRYLVTGSLIALFIIMTLLYSVTRPSGVNYGITVTEKGSSHAVSYNFLESYRVMENRTKTVQNICKNMEEKRQDKLNPKLYYRLWVDDKYKLIYCVVPKVACTNWKRVFLYLSGKVNISDPQQLSSRQVHFELSGQVRTLNTYTQEQVKYRLKNYLKFMFVRDPLERLLSAYRNKFTLTYNEDFHFKYGTRIIRKYRINAKKESLSNGHDVTFEEFVRYLLDSKKRAKFFNAHWRPLSDLCHPCSVKYDIIGKYETFNKDVQYVLKRAGVDKLVEFPKAPESMQRTGVLTKNFYKKITAAQIHKLWQLYSLDYAMFAYPYPKFS